MMAEGVLSGLDDPRGEHFRNLEAQVQRLESEIARLEVLVEAASAPRLKRRLLLSD
jgi:hypothetical protein